MRNYREKRPKTHDCKVCFPELCARVEEMPIPQVVSRLQLMSIVHSQCSSPANFTELSEFNFQSQDSEAEKSTSTVDTEQAVPAHQCREIVSHDNSNLPFKSLFVENLTFTVRDLETTKDAADLSFLTSYKNCDVIPAVYEGGLKVWECTYDLLHFLMHNEIDFQGKTVLDLGCGCGLLGIYAALKGAQAVHFQDYNADVLEKFTIPNVQSNGVTSSTRFISGDWDGFASFSAISDVSYDYILSSETLYSPKNYPKLCNLFIQKLRNQGEVFMASKSYYFGVGGSIKQFEEFLDKQNRFHWKTAWKNTDGYYDF